MWTAPLDVERSKEKQRGDTLYGGDAHDHARKLNVSVVENVEPGERGVHISVQIRRAAKQRHPDHVSGRQMQNGHVR